MRQNFTTMLAVFVTIFALAWFLSRGKVRQAELQSTVLHNEIAAVDSAGPSLTRSEPLAGRPDSAFTGAVSPAGEAADPSHSPQAAPPEHDSIPRDPPNGMVFAGTGRFQLYRQGDITWRLDTSTGRACILFATDEQWRLERVLAHGCGAP